MWSNMVKCVLEFRLSFPYGIVCRLFTGSGTKRHQRHQAAPSGTSGTKRHQRHQAAPTAPSGTKRHTSSFGILVDRSKENYSHSRNEKHVSPKKTKLLWAENASQIADETLSPFDTLSSLCALFHAPKRSIADNPQRNNCNYLPLSTSHNTQLMGKHDFVVGTAWRCCVTCSLPHRTAKSRKSCQDINCRYNKRNMSTVRWLLGHSTKCKLH
jgi:hypothetical protein